MIENFQILLWDIKGNKFKGNICYTIIYVSQLLIYNIVM